MLVSAQRLKSVTRVHRFYLLISSSPVNSIFHIRCDCTLSVTHRFDVSQALCPLPLNSTPPNIYSYSRRSELTYKNEQFQKKIRELEESLEKANNPIRSKTTNAGKAEAITTEMYYRILYCVQCTPHKLHILASSV